MQAIETLMREHELIEKALGLLETVVRGIRAGDAMPKAFPEWMVGFIRNFADGVHHQKEELALFPLMEQRGVPKQGGPLGCMLHEHELGRALTRAMEEAAASGELRRFADAAEEYIVLLREHILKENCVLFRIAERCLGTGDDETLVRQFHAADLASTQNRESRGYLTEVDAWQQLLAQLAPRPADYPAVTVSACPAPPK